MTTSSHGYELPLLLFAAFRGLIDELHSELALRGHPGLRPAHGFALQAIAAAPISAADLGRVLGVSKQAAGKTIDRLDELGYVTRTVDRSDTRRRTVALTETGSDVLRQSAEIFDELRERWQAKLGSEAVADVESHLRAVTNEQNLRLDTTGWLSSP
jgi:DNA-binding MarR family transcriptional regulator